MVTKNWQGGSSLRSFFRSGTTGCVLTSLICCVRITMDIRSGHGSLMSRLFQEFSAPGRSWAALI